MLPPAELAAVDDSAPRRRGPAPRISAEQISEAVLDLGFDQASLNAVAAELGVKHGALYRYIGDRDGMMRTALDLAIARFQWPEPATDWRRTMHNEALAWWDFCTTHRGFVEVLSEVGTVPPSLALRSLTVATRLWELGVEATDAVLIVDLVAGTIHNEFLWTSQRSSAIDEVNGLPDEDVARYSAGVPDELLGVVVEQLIDDPWPWFERKLELMLAGVSTRPS